LNLPLFVSADATEQVLNWPDMIECLRMAYSIELSDVCNPPRTAAYGDGNWLRTLTAVPPVGRFMGSKVFGLSREKSVNYLITLFDQDSGEIVGLIDGNEITSLRTAATSALAVSLMAGTQPMTVGVLGSGTEAHAHLAAISSVVEISKANIFSPTQANRERFAANYSEKLNVPCIAVGSPREAVEACDIVIGATNAMTGSPILLGEWLTPQALVVAIGSTMSKQHEIDPRTIEVSDLIVCDMIEEIVHETGDFIAAREAGVAFENKLVSLDELVRGDLNDRLATASRTMFKSVGSAVQDIAVAELAFNRAVDNGLAIELPIEFRVKQA